jgi:hypothetical protein
MPQYRCAPSQVHCLKKLALDHGNFVQSTSLFMTSFFLLPGIYPHTDLKANSTKGEHHNDFAHLHHVIHPSWAFVDTHQDDNTRPVKDSNTLDSTGFNGAVHFAY